MGSRWRPNWWWSQEWRNNPVYLKWRRSYLLKFSFNNCLIQGTNRGFSVISCTEQAMDDWNKWKGKSSTPLKEQENTFSWTRLMGDRLWVTGVRKNRKRTDAKHCDIPYKTKERQLINHSNDKYIPVWQREQTKERCSIGKVGKKLQSLLCPFRRYGLRSLRPTLAISFSKK